MCPEEGGAAGLGELRSWWEVPAIAHFCSLFRTAFRLPDFEIEVSGREERARWRTPRPFLPSPPRESGSTVREGAGGTRRLWPVVRSQGKGSEVGARGAQGPERGRGPRRAPQGTPSAGVRVRDVRSWPPCPPAPSGARRSGRREGGGRVRFCTSGTRPTLPGLLGQEAECVGRVRARAPCPVPLKRRASCSGRGRGAGWINSDRAGRRPAAVWGRGLSCCGEARPHIGGRVEGESDFADCRRPATLGGALG